MRQKKRDQNSEEKQLISLSIPNEIKKQLQKSAEKNARSLAGEIRYRLTHPVKDGTQIDADHLLALIEASGKRRAMAKRRKQ